MKLKYKLVLFLILILGAFLRLYNLNWDQGFHLHPDERAIVIFTTPLKTPTDIQEFFSPKSPWNPHFFAYGNFPLYFLKIVGEIAGGFNPILSQYGQINLVGRFLSALSDLGTLTLIFILGRKVFNKKTGLIAAFFYAVTTFSIQVSHFYAVDTLLTFFFLLTLYQLLRFYEKPTKTKAIILGIFTGLSLATKNSALVLLFSIGIALIIDFLLIFLKNPHHPRIWFPHLPKLIKTLITDGIIIMVVTAVIFAIFEPYAVLDFREFWQQTREQYKMTHDAFTFPYTLQYVGKIPYFYEIKNIFLWGQGPILATVCFLGTLYFTFIAVRKKKEDKWAQELILSVFFWSYFLVVGSFAIGFMRYMLPLYPLLCLFGSVFFLRLINLLPKTYRILFSIFYLLFIIAWPLSFMYIYTKPNTRVLASQWINQNIKIGKTLAVEHWDDSLPLFEQQKYNILTLPLYDPDTPQKWIMINRLLSQTDYIIIGSNRLYVPLQKLTNCERLPVGRCYVQTARYYRQLLNGQLGFQKVAEFAIYPKIPFINSTINDQGADESFTVYDHPKIMIFKKTLDRKSL